MEIFTTLGDHGPVLLLLYTGIAVLAGTVALRYYRIWQAKVQLRAIPFVDTSDGDFKKAAREASARYPNTPFVLGTGSNGKPRVILPHGVMDEVRKLPQTQLSLRKDLYEKMHGRWTDIATNHDLGIEAIRKDLTNHIAELLPEMQDEVRYALDTHFEEFPRWTQVVLFPKLVQLSCLVNGRFFVGPLCRDSRWTELALAFSVDIMASIQAIEAVKKYMRPLIAPFLPPVKRLNQYKARATELLRPLVNSALEVHQKSTGRSQQVSRDPKAPKGDNGSGLNLISWMLNHVDTSKPVNVRDLAREQLFIGGGSIHSSGVALVNMLYDLASHPEYIPELRAEIDAALASEPDGKMRKNSLSKMRKLDSLMLESHRMNPVGMTSLHRRVTDPNGLRLSTGHVIPYNASVCFLHPNSSWATPTPELNAINRSRKGPPLNEFYPFRWSELRDEPGQDGYHQYSQTSPENIHFGHGPGSCPGRWFAGTSLKVSIMEILRRYDIALGPDGQGIGNGFERPATRVLPGSLKDMPDLEASIYFKSRQYSNEKN